jgi:hypothetical protein
MSLDLYTTTDVKKVREELTKKQGGIDPITGLVIPDKQAVLDHDHKTQYVRAVLHRQTNAVLGKIENLWTRYLGWWYTGTLPEFLRGVADYLEKEHPQDYAHPRWLKKVTTEFNKLPEASKRSVLINLGQGEGKNGAERKKLFQSALKTRKYGFNEVSLMIEKSKESF